MRVRSHIGSLSEQKSGPSHMTGRTDRAGFRRLRFSFFSNNKRICARVWACSSARLERTPDKREVGSSSLPRPTTNLSWRAASEPREIECPPKL